MKALDDTILEALLGIDSQGKVVKAEDDKLEFKLLFDNSNKEARAKYAKEMASLYNYEGGYLIFGVDDVTNQLIGLNGFEEPDNAEIANDINNYFQPAIRFSSRSYKINEKMVFVIYVEKRSSIPTVCIKEHQSILNKATIYWRYSAKSSPIEAGDLIDLLHKLKGETAQEALKLDKAIAEAQFRPQLHLSSGNADFNTIQLRIRNDGKQAHLKQVDILEGDFYPLNGRYNNSKILETGKIVIEIKAKEMGNTANKEYRLLLKYEDEIGTTYEKVIKGRGARANFEN